MQTYQVKSVRKTLKRAPNTANLEQPNIITDEAAVKYELAKLKRAKHRDNLIINVLYFSIIGLKTLLLLVFDSALSIIGVLVLWVLLRSIIDNFKKYNIPLDNYSLYPRKIRNDKFYRFKRRF